MGFLKFLTSKVFVKQLIIAAIAILVISFLALRWLKSTTNHGEFVKVPDLKGTSVETAKIKLKDRDLDLVLQDSANYNPDYPKYAVIDQEPKANAQVKENRKIYLTINPSGYRKIAVPDILKRTYRQAKPTLEALGFQVGEITYKNALGEGVMQMTHQNRIINPGELLPKTSKIDLIIGNGKGKISN